MEIKNPRWEDVCQAIRRLDNNRFNDVYLQRSEDSETFWLAVGGGDGLYVITGKAESNRFPTVVDPRLGDSGRRELVVGGQVGLYPESWIQNLETALHAAKYFLDHDDFGGELNWKDV